MSERKYLDTFKAKCKEISNKFNLDDKVSACFVCNYSDKADICRDCSKKAECSLIAEQLKAGGNSES